MTRPVVTIIGAGVIGMACAVQLQRAGHQVHVIDSRAPGEGCSRGNAGIIDVDQVLPIATPSVIRRVPRMLFDPMSPLALRWRYLPVAAPWLVRFLRNATPGRVDRISQSLAALTRPALAAWRDLLGAVGGEGLIEQRGWLAVYRTEARFHRDAADRRRQKAHGVRFEELAAAELRQHEPALAGNSLARGLLYPDSASSINSFRLVQHLAAQVERARGSFTRAQVKAIETGPDGPRLLHTEAGPIAVERLLISGGAWSKTLAEQVGHRVPLETERGYHIQLATPGLTLRRPVCDAERKFFMTPMETGLRIAGTVEFGGLVAAPNWKRADILLRQAQDLLPDLNAAGPERWMGFRPTLPDSLPVIGPSPAMPNLWFAFGHQHLGLTMAAVTGQLIAAMVDGRPAPIDAAPYRIDRF